MKLEHTNHTGDQLSMKKAAAVSDLIKRREIEEVLPCPGRGFDLLRFIPSQGLSRNNIVHLLYVEARQLEV
jgi:hypothetical protein